jgi:hypothetical protein
MTDEQFFAWLDGELDAAEAAQVEARVAADPELTRLAEQHRAFGRQLRATFDPIAAAPVPERLLRAAKPATVIDLGSRREGRQRRWSPVPQWAAMAATLALGIFVGSVANRSGTDSPIEIQGGKMYAAADLDQALDRQLASGQQGDVRVALTFRDQSGAVCRSFANSNSSGLACRDGSNWQVRGLFAAPEGQSGEYRMAAGANPALGALIDSTISGEPFDARQERAARDSGWR